MLTDASNIERDQIKRLGDRMKRTRAQEASVTKQLARPARTRSSALDELGGSLGSV